MRGINRNPDVSHVVAWGQEEAVINWTVFGEEAEHSFWTAVFLKSVLLEWEAGSSVVTYHTVLETLWGTDSVGVLDGPSIPNRSLSGKSLLV